MLSLRNITKRLEGFAIRDVSFDVAEGEYFVLLGASAVGKTVLLETIAGLLDPEAGQILLDGRDITGERIQKRRISLVYQDRALFPHLSVRQNIAYGLRCRRLPRARAAERTGKLAERVGVEHLLDRGTETLSGGEAQRVALARALGTEPRCLLLDEPLSALDTNSRAQMRSLLRKLNRRGHTLLHVTHDYEEAISLASRVAIMEAGRIVQVGTPDEVFRHPKSEFVARFIGIRNCFKGRLRYSAGDGALGEFVTAGPVFRVLAEAPAGPGYLMLRSEDITVANARSETSARNTFVGIIVDIAAARLGVEVSVDIGVEVSALVTAASVAKLNLACGKEVCVSFKASAARFIEG